jgi:hypothetical protein
MLLVRVLRDDLLGRLENINILFPLPDYTWHGNICKLWALVTEF